MRRKRDDKYVYFPTLSECADAAVSVFAANRWRWARCGIPDRARIVETLAMLHDAMEGDLGRQESGRLVYDRERGYGHEIPLTSKERK